MTILVPISLEYKLSIFFSFKKSDLQSTWKGSLRIGMLITEINYEPIHQEVLQFIVQFAVKKP